MNFELLNEVKSQTAEWQPPDAIGKFDAERVPEIEISVAENVTRLTAAVSPDCSYRMVRDAIRSAQSEILLYIYNVSADHLIDLLRERKDAGVRIRLMFDTHDTRGDEREKLRQLDVDMKEAPSSKGRQVFTVCHQKFAVIDERTLLVESANWAGTSIPKVEIPGKFKKGNREWLLRIDDEELAGWFKELFEADWDIPEMESPSGGFQIPAEEPPRQILVPSLIVNAPDTVFDLKEFDLDSPVRVTPIISPDNYFKTARQVILDAQESVYLQQQYILAGGSKTEALLEALEQRKDEIDIRIMVSPAFRKINQVDNWELSAKALDAYGLKGRLRAVNTNYYTHCHNKGLIADRKIVFVSSTNWSENSITKARETGVMVESAEVAEYFAQVFDFDWSIGWDAADVPDNLLRVFGEAMFEPDAFEEIHPADLA